MNPNPPTASAPPPRWRPASCLLAAVLLLLGPGAAQALPAGVTLEILGSDRHIEAYATSYCPGCGPGGEDEIFSNGDDDGTTSSGPFDASVSSAGSSAQQTSVISSTELSGSGGIGLGFTGDNDAASRLSAQFRVSQDVSLRLQGELALSDFPDLDDFHVALSDTGGDLFRARGYGDEGPFDAVVQLEAGAVYTLEASVSGYDFSGNPGGASWTFALVPEPAAGLLVGVGLAGLAAARRRRA